MSESGPLMVFLLILSVFCFLAGGPSFTSSTYLALFPNADILDLSLDLSLDTSLYYFTFLK